MLKRLWLLLLGVFVIVYFFVPFANARPDESLNTVQDLSESLYQNAKAKNYEQAKLIVEELSQIMPTIKYNGLTSVEGIEAITSTIILSKGSLSSLEPKYEDVMQHVTQLYLAIDALEHKEEPLWHRYYTPLKSDLNEIRIAIEESNLHKTQASIQNFQLRYHQIKPALFVSKQPFTIEKIDSLITALVSQTVEQNKGIILNQLEQDIQKLFFGDDKETWGELMRQQVLWKTSIGMGLFIFLALSYVTWRKFKASYSSSTNI